MANKEKGAGGEKELQKSYFEVLNLCCSSEVPLIENILKSLQGVKEFSVIVPTKTVIVVHDTLLISQLEIVKALNKARLEANVRAYGESNFKKKWPSPFAVASGFLLLVSFFKYLYHPLRWLALGAVAVGAVPIILKATASIRNFRLDTNILMLIAVIGTIAMNDYTEAGTIVFLFTIAEWLESRASHKANAVMSSLMSIAPQKAVMAQNGEEVSVGHVKLNTLLAVKAGEVIPIDGIVVDGNCEVDEKALTGESFPVPKEKDSTVLAGSINLNGYITVKTTAMAEDCVVAKMAKLVEEAQNSKSKTQRFIDKCAQYYTPAIILISAGLAVAPLALRLHNRNHWFHLALVVLVSACPCALILSTPVATFCALTNAATVGLLIKGGDYLETLAKIKVMAFDKTGTITKGEFVVTDFQSLSADISLDSLIYWVSSIESKSSHPMAAALVDYGKSFSIEPKPENVEAFQNFPGEGICGKIDGREIYIGNRKIALKAKSTTVPTVGEHIKRGKTAGYVYSDGVPVGIFNLSDSCRIGVAESIKALKQLGIKTAMLTGDSEGAAMHAQEQLGNALEAVHAELLPEDKARIIREFKKDGPTAMIGDGINDAPALATADIGISMGISGSALATETGNVILMSNDIRKVPKAVQLARQAHNKVIQNVIMSISTKAAILALAFAGHPLVWAAVLADVGTCVVVILNSMLLLRGAHEKHAGKCCKSSKHTHGRSSKDLSHYHKKCCSNQNSQEVCKSQNCTSGCQPTLVNVNSCRGSKCVDSTGKKEKCTDDHNGVHEAVSKIERALERNDCHGCCNKVEQDLEQNDCHGCCNKVEQDLEQNDPHDNCCSGSKNTSTCLSHECSNSPERQGTCTERDVTQGTKHHCHHKQSETTCCNNSAHDIDLEQGQRMTDHGNYHSNHCGKEHATTINIEESLEGIVVESSCSQKHQHHHHHQNLHYDKCCQSAEILRCTDYSERITRHTCLSLEKREIGGCCKSYMKECCHKHGHFSPGIGVGLSEIITE